MQFTLAEHTAIFTAIEAADTIHSDIARGFIRCEVIRWDDLVAAGSHAEAARAAADFVRRNLWDERRDILQRRYRAGESAIDGFLDEPLPAAIRERARRAERVLALEDAVAAAMKALQEKGFQSPYLRPFVVARINPLRFQKGGAPEFDPTIDKMIASANKFNAESVKPEQLARAGGAPAGDE
jgi:hypothetical protein